MLRAIVDWCALSGFVPKGLLKPHKCQVVLAGDPKQLGPIISSMLAETHGLGENSVTNTRVRF